MVSWAIRAAICCKAPSSLEVEIPRIGLSFARMLQARVRLKLGFSRACGLNNLTARFKKGRAFGKGSWGGLEVQDGLHESRECISIALVVRHILSAGSQCNCSEYIVRKLSFHINTFTSTFKRMLVAAYTLMS